MALGGAAIGGRVGYILINWGYFEENIAEIPQVWLGGFSWIGVMAGGCLAILIMAWKRGISAGDLSDSLRPLFAATVASVWLANWMLGNAYGVKVEAWWGIPAKDEWGIITQRWPTQILCIFSALGLHWVLDRIATRKLIRLPGISAILEIGGFFLTMVAISPFRGDSAPRWAGMRLDTSVSIFCVILCMLLLIIITLRNTINRKAKTESSDHEN